MCWSVKFCVHFNAHICPCLNDVLMNIYVGVYSIMKPWHPGSPTLLAEQPGSFLHTEEGCQRWHTCQCAHGSAQSQCRAHCLHLPLIKQQSRDSFSDELLRTNNLQYEVYFITIFSMWWKATIKNPLTDVFSCFICSATENHQHLDSYLMLPKRKIVTNNAQYIHMFSTYPLWWNQSFQPWTWKYS